MIGERFDHNSNRVAARCGGLECAGSRCLQPAGSRPHLHCRADGTGAEHGCASTDRQPDSVACADEYGYAQPYCQAPQHGPACFHSNFDSYTSASHGHTDA